MSNMVAFVPYSIPWGSKKIEGVHGVSFPVRGEKDLEARVLMAMVSQNNGISFCYEVYHKEKGIIGIVSPKAVPRDGP